MRIDDRIMACLQWFKDSGGFGPGPQEPPRPAAPALVPAPPLQLQEERRGHDRARGKFQRVPADSSKSSDEEVGSETQAYGDNDDQDHVLLEVAATAAGRYDRSEMQVFLVGALPALPSNA